MTITLRMSPLEWALERLENSERIAGLRTGKDREGWLEDAAYWRAIITALKNGDRTPDTTTEPSPELDSTR